MSRTLLRSTSLVSAMTFISRILGFVRDMIVAQIFGASAGADAFYVAFKIPNFMRALFAEGSFSQAFVPVLSDYRHQKSHEEVRALISHVMANLSIVLFVVTLIGILAAPLVVKIFAPGLDPLRYQLSSEMLRITFPYLMLISLTALAGAILNSYGAFGVAAFTPSLLNVCMIFAALYLAPHFKVPVMALAWGVFGAGIVQLLFLMPFLAKKQLLPIPHMNWQDPGVSKILRLMLPALFGASIGQISLLLNTIFASFLPTGSVTWLYYSDRLAYFPLGVFGVALATVVLPHLSRHHSVKSEQEFSATLDWGLRCNLVIGLPASVTMLAFAGPLIVTLFQYGKFNGFDAEMTRRSVMAYALGLQAFMLAKVLASAFYARQDVRTPVRVSVIVLTLNMILNTLAFSPLAHAGLALASSLASWSNVIILLWILRRRGQYQLQPGWPLFLLRLAMANGVLAAYLMWYGGNWEIWSSWHWHQRFSQVFLAGSSAILLYIGLLFIGGMRMSDLRTKKVK